LIKGIIFDLGDTLIELRDTEAVARTGAEALVEWYLTKKRIKLDQPALVEAFLAERQRGIAQADQTQTEILTRHWLESALDKVEAPAKTKAGPLLDAAIKIFFEPAEKTWQPYPDAIATLKSLHSQKHRLGVYSNASDDAFVQRLINVNKFRPYFSATLSSAGLGWRKPRPDGFLLIARRWEIAPAEIVVVGDSLNTDILGAHKAGMPSILVTMRESPANDTHRHIVPTTSIARVSDLPELIARL
jgi:putative hydrolase of the HAD superfamily